MTTVLLLMVVGGLVGLLIVVARRESALAASASDDFKCWLSAPPPPEAGVEADIAELLGPDVARARAPGCWLHQRTFTHPAVLPAMSGDPIPPGKVVNIYSRPMMPFQVERLHVGDHAADFDILDVRIGRHSECINADAMPAETFATPREGAVYDLIRRDGGQGPVDIPLPLATEASKGGERIASGQIVELFADLITVVRNRGDVPRAFRAAYIGRRASTKL